MLSMSVVLIHSMVEKRQEPKDCMSTVLKVFDLYRMETSVPFILSLIPTAGLALAACVLGCLNRQEVAEQRRELQALIQQLVQPVPQYYPPRLLTAPAPSAPPGPSHTIV